MHTFYVDESWDASTFVLTAICIKDTNWRAAFDATKEFRRSLKADHGIKMTAELHAHKFVRKVNDNISPQTVSLRTRRLIFESAIRHVSQLPVVLFNAVMNVPRWGTAQRAQEIAIERISNRIQRMMRDDSENSHAVAIFDKGRESDITKIVRRLGVFNPIPSAYGAWGDGRASRNITLSRFIDDPFFKDSRASYFLQLADFCAWSLLKSEVTATGFVAEMGYDKLFDLLDGVCHRPANRRDPRGIVRG